MEPYVYCKSIVEQDTAPVVVCDPQHTIVYMNPAAVLRYQKWGGQSLVGRSLLDCHNAASAAVIRQAAERFAASAQQDRLFIGHHARENRDTYMIALRDEQGQFIGYYEKHEYRTPETAVPYSAAETGKKGL